MHMDPLMPTLVGAALCILLLVLVMRRLRQPHVVAYLLAGVALGGHGLHLFPDEETVGRLGDIGVVLLLFFVGMEVSIPRLLASWRISIVGTLVQIAISLACVYVIGMWFQWPLTRVVLLGFAISLSSTAMVVSMVRAWRLSDSQTGQDAIGILLVQDMALVPMLIVLGFLAGDQPTSGQLARQLVGGGGILGILLVIARRGHVSLPFGRLLRNDHELQVFAAFLLCFGVALVTALLGLSSALGAFVAGVIIGAARETDWIHRSLEPFRVIMVALFFVSIGMLIDLRFVAANWGMVVALVAAALLTNTVINACILRVLGRSWRVSAYVAALLAQIGEFSFVLAAVGRQNGIITDYSYQATIAVIAITLILSPLWVLPFRR